MSTKEPTLSSWVSEYLIPIGTLLFAALALFAQDVLPTWISIVAVSCLIIVTVVSLRPLVVRVLSSLVNKWRLRHLARTCFPQLLEDVKRFRRLIARQSTNTLLYVLRQAAQCDEQKAKSLLPDPEYVETIDNWLLSIEQRISRHKPGDFLVLCKEMSALILWYNRFCYGQLNKLEELIAARGLSEAQLHQIKQQWNVQRDGHSVFVREWETFARRINEEIGSEICFDYYEQVGTLE